MADTDLTLENIGKLIDIKLDTKFTEFDKKISLQFLKIEKQLGELKADNKRHDNRFKTIDADFKSLNTRFDVFDSELRAIKERLNEIEETLHIEREKYGGTIQERLNNLQDQIDIIIAKLKAG